MTNEEKILDMLTQMQADISDIKTDVADLRTDVDGIKTDVSELRTDVDGIKVVLESDIARKLNLLAEGRTTMFDKLILEHIEDMEAEISVLKAVSKEHTREINRLKKAQ